MWLVRYCLRYHITLRRRHPGQGYCNTLVNAQEEQTPSDDPHSASISKSQDAALSRLESLPTELLIMILSSAPDLPTLNALARSSPILHAHYLYSRDEILRACLGRELDGLFVDAYAFERSRPSRFGKFRRDQDIVDYFDEYRAWHSSPDRLPTIQSLHFVTVRSMAHYHLSVARPVARLYSSWALSNLEKKPASLNGQQREALSRKAEVAEASVTTDDQPVELSRSEEIRVLQALYRYETYHHLFGTTSSKRWGGFMAAETNEMFCCLYDPWEVEAIGCIDLLVRSKYEELFDQVKVDLHPDNDRFRHNPCGSFDFISGYEHDEYMDGTVAHGLTLLMELLKIQDHDQLVSEMQEKLDFCRNLDPHMREMLETTTQHERREESANFPNSKDRAEQRREPMHFIGDFVPPRGPPFAWVALWGGKYSNIYGEHVPTSLRQWGYVMWDRKRWIDMGLDGKIILKQWEEFPDFANTFEVYYDYSPLGC